MSAKSQHKNILLAVLGFAAVVVIVAVIGFLALDRDPDIIQGQVEVSEYRVSSKVPGRILELRVKEGLCRLCHVPYLRRLYHGH